MVVVLPLSSGLAATMENGVCNTDATAPTIHCTVSGDNPAVKDTVVVGVTPLLSGTGGLVTEAARE